MCAPVHEKSDKCRFAQRFAFFALSGSLGLTARLVGGTFRAAYLALGFALGHQFVAAGFFSRFYAARLFEPFVCFTLAALSVAALDLLAGCGGIGGVAATTRAGLRSRLHVVVAGVTAHSCTLPLLGTEHGFAPI